MRSDDAPRGLLSKPSPQAFAMSRTPRSIFAPVVTAASLSFALAGCATTASHSSLETRVAQLETQVAARDTQLQETIAAAEASMDELQKRLKEAEQLLRSNQANLGLQVQDMQEELAMVRGLAEDSQNEAAALASNVDEMRESVDARVSNLEAKLNEATDIPEGKTPLLNEAERELRGKNYKRARTLFRTYLTRYPSDKKEPEVRFKIGLTLYSERDYRSALGEFYWIVQSAPESEQIHDALYYSGLAFAKVGQCSKAIAYFTALAAEGSEAPDRYKKQATKQVGVLEKDDGTICLDKAQSKDETEGAS